MTDEDRRELQQLREDNEKLKTHFLCQIKECQFNKDPYCKYNKTVLINTNGVHCNYYLEYSRRTISQFSKGSNKGESK